MCERGVREKPEPFVERLLCGWPLVYCRYAVEQERACASCLFAYGMLAENARIQCFHPHPCARYCWDKTEWSRWTEDGVTCDGDCRLLFRCECVHCAV